MTRVSDMMNSCQNDTQVKYNFQIRIKKYLERDAEQLSNYERY